MKLLGALAGNICPCISLRGHHRPRQVKQDPESGRRGLGDLHWHWSCNPQHATPDGKGRVADVLPNPRLKWQLLRGSAAPRGKGFAPSRCPTLLSHSILRKNVSSHGKWASVACEEAKEKGTWHTIPTESGWTFPACNFVLPLNYNSVNQLNYNSVNGVTESAPVFLLSAQLLFFMDSDVKHHNCIKQGKIWVPLSVTSQIFIYNNYCYLLQFSVIHFGSGQTVERAVN